MIVRRFTHKAKVGRKSELVDVLKGWLEKSGLTGRVCSSYYGWDTVSCDLEFETSEDLDKLWGNFDWNQPFAVEFLKKLDELRESGSTKETWRVH